MHQAIAYLAYDPTNSKLYGQTHHYVTGNEMVVAVFVVFALLIFALLSKVFSA